jgi:hypothetical protein
MIGRADALEHPFCEVRLPAPPAPSRIRPEGCTVVQAAGCPLLAVSPPLCSSPPLDPGPVHARHVCGQVVQPVSTGTLQSLLNHPVLETCTVLRTERYRDQTDGHHARNKTSPTCLWRRKTFRTLCTAPSSCTTSPSDPSSPSRVAPQGASSSDRSRHLTPCLRVALPLLSHAPDCRPGTAATSSLVCRREGAITSSSSRAKHSPALPSPVVPASTSRLGTEVGLPRAT